MKDADGNTLSVGESVWYDDKVSPDWVQGTITALASAFAIINGSPVVYPLIHVNKPPNPPDR